MVLAQSEIVFITRIYQYTTQDCPVLYACIDCKMFHLKTLQKVLSKVLSINIGHGGNWIDFVMKIYTDKYLDLTKALSQHTALFSYWQHENLHEK